MLFIAPSKISVSLLLLTGFFMNFIAFSADRVTSWRASATGTIRLVTCYLISVLGVCLLFWLVCFLSGVCGLCIHNCSLTLIDVGRGTSLGLLLGIVCGLLIRLTS